MRIKEVSVDSACFWVKRGTRNNLEEKQPFFNAGNGGYFRSVLFSRGKISGRFFTEDSKLYITPREQEDIKQGIKPVRIIKKWDSLSRRIVGSYEFQRKKRKGSSWQIGFLQEKFLDYRLRIEESLKESARSFRRQWTMQQLWNFSVIGAVLLGMISMSLIYKFLGPGASAGSYAEGNIPRDQESVLVAEGPAVSRISEVLGASAEKSPLVDDDSLKYIEEIAVDLENKKNDEFEKRIRKMVKGYPIEKMVPEIVKKDKIIAAFLVGIAKKESNWGKRVPVLNGEDCYNYWGYKGQRTRMGTGGHTCFDSRKDAVDTVAKRLETLVQKQNRNTPAKLILWKCGSACDKDNQQAVKKWISDVELYFSQLKN